MRFGLVGNTEEKIGGSIMNSFLGWFFQGGFFRVKNILAFAPKKLHPLKVIKPKNFNI